MTRLRLALCLSLAVACSAPAAAYVYHKPYYPEGWEPYAERFRSLPEVERFHSVFPGAEPGRTLMAGYPVGYSAHDGGAVV